MKSDIINIFHSNESDIPAGVNCHYEYYRVGRQELEFVENVYGLQKFKNLEGEGGVLKCLPSYFNQPSVYRK